MPTPISPRIPSPDEHQICAFETNNLIEAGALAEQLVAGGVACDVQAVSPATHHEKPKQRLMIWSDDASRAEEIMRAIQRHDGQVRS